jgi:hypothetical protein
LLDSRLRGSDGKLIVIPVQAGVQTGISAAGFDFVGFDSAQPTTLGVP